MRAPLLAIGGVALVVAATWSAPALAQPSAAVAAPPAVSAADRYARHMDNGVRLYRSGDHVAALAEFEAAYAAKPGPSPLINQALCHRDRFRYPLAIAALERALAAHGPSMAAGERAVVEESLRELRGLLAHVRVEIDPADAVVSVDGEDLPPGGARALIPLGPGPHRIAARANGRVPQEERIDVASGEERALRFSLPFATGTVRVTAAAPTTPIEIDGEVVARGDWSGPLRAGRHEVRLVGEGTALSIDVAPGEALDVRGHGSGTGVRSLPAPPPPPPPPAERAERARTGPYVTLGGSLLAPTAGPVRPEDATAGLAAMLALRGGWRATSFAAFELLGGVAATSGEAEDGASSWSRTSVRGGGAVRLATPGRSVRITGALGGGVSWDEVEAGDAGGTAASGLDPFGLAEVGLEVETRGLLLGVAVELWLDGVAGISTDAGDTPWDGPIVPAIGPSLRAGYAF